MAKAKAKQSPLKKLQNSLYGIVLGLSMGVGYEEFYGIGTWHGADIKTHTMNVCFTPPSGCGSLIAREIQKAQKTIHIQAYGLTSFAIINQLIDASRRGVKIRAILDSSNFSETKSVVSDLRNAGVEVMLDKISGIAHNKIMILDGRRVITGSFNFTEAADRRNAENVLLIEDRNIANIYLENWKKRLESAKGAL